MILSCHDSVTSKSGENLEFGVSGSESISRSTIHAPGPTTASPVSILVFPQTVEMSLAVEEISHRVLLLAESEWNRKPRRAWQLLRRFKHETSSGGWPG